MNKLTMPKIKQLQVPGFTTTKPTNFNIKEMLELLVILVVGIALFLFMRVYCTNIAGGGDSWGYVSEAIRLSHGHFYEVEHVFTQFGLPENSNLTFPHGYRPFGATGLVPAYPFGYPLLMAVAKRLFGFAKVFWVTPILGAGAVILTYLTGRQLLGKLGGIIAAALVFICPNFLWSSFQPMSDVPATFFTVLALYALLASSPSIRSTALLAFAEGVAIWIRPNMILLVMATVLWFVANKSWQRLMVFGFLLLPFISVEGAINQYLYGAPWITGYGHLPWAPSLNDAVQRAFRYLNRLQDQQAGIGLILFSASIIFSKLSWQIRALLLGIVSLFFLFFSFYPIDDAWWYGRFLLPTLPAIALLETSVLLRLTKISRYRFACLSVLAICAILFIYGSITYSMSHDVFTSAIGEQRYRTAAEFTRDHIQQPALVLTAQHSGSFRLYSGLPSARYDQGTLPEFMSILNKVQRAGGHIYLLEDKGAVDMLKKSNRSILLRGSELIGEVQPGPVLLYHLHPTFNLGDQKKL